MRTLALLLLLLGAAPVSAWSQSTLNFPRSLTVPERGSTGLAIANPGSEPAPVEFRLFSPAGALLAAGTRTVPAGGQVAAFGSELFPGVPGSGWIQAESPAAGLVGYWLGGDFTTSTDGASDAPARLEHLLPVAGGQTEIHLANPGGDPALSMLRLHASDGTVLASRTDELAPKANLHSTLPGLFPGVDLSAATHLWILSGAPSSALAVLRDYLTSPSLAAVNSADAGLFVPLVDFPHVLVDGRGGSGFQTIISLTNLSPDPQTVRMVLSTADGGQSTGAVVELAGHATLRDSAQNIFGFFANAHWDGWIHVRGESGLAGFAAYVHPDLRVSTVVPTRSHPSTTLLFPHIADLSPWMTGVALVNENDIPARVEVFAVSPSGELIGRTEFTLGARSKTAQPLSAWIPGTQARASDGGFVYVRTNGVPISGTALLLKRDLSLLANLPAGLAEDYTPPAP